MKIVLVGDTQVGKTCLIRRLANGDYTDENPPTIGAAFQNHLIQTAKGTVALQIWDTAGQEKFRSLTPMYYRSAAIAILCFDLTNSASFQSLEQWTMELSEKAPDHLKVVIVGTKKDLVEQRQINYETARQFAEENGCLFYAETSAKTNEGITELFTEIAEYGGPDVPAVAINDSDASVQIPKKEKQNCC